MIAALERIERILLSLGLEPQAPITDGGRKQALRLLEEIARHTGSLRLSLEEETIS